MSTRLICAPLLLAILLPGSASEQPRAPAAALAQAPLQPRYDCNGNGVEDAVDIALGTSCDADLDGVPDECQGARNLLRRQGTPAPARGS